MKERTNAILFKILIGLWLIGTTFGTLMFSDVIENQITETETECYDRYGNEIKGEICIKTTDLGYNIVLGSGAVLVIGIATLFFIEIKEF